MDAIRLKLDAPDGDGVVEWEFAFSQLPRVGDILKFEDTYYIVEGVLWKESSKLVSPSRIIVSPYEPSQADALIRTSLLSDSVDLRD